MPGIAMRTTVSAPPPSWSYPVDPPSRVLAAPVVAPSPGYRWLPPVPPPAQFQADARARSDPALDVDSIDAKRAAQQRSDDWTLSVEGVSRMPIDVGVGVVLELPIAFRVSAGYGWVPVPYLNLVSQLTSMGSQASALLSHAFQSGRTWRVQGGLRPFRSLGLYVDAGYSQLRLDGAIDASSVPGVPLSGRYTADTTVGMWLVELGYEAWIADHIVLGVAGGMVGATSSRSHLAGPGVSASDASDAASTFDAQIVRYGKIPTLTARLGFDFI